MAGTREETIEALERMSGKREESQTRLFEELEDALKLALQIAGKVHVMMPASSQPRNLNWENSESLGDYLRRALAEVRTRLNVVYAQEIRKQRGRE